MEWAVGVTTVPSRLANLLPLTLKALREGGFPKPHLFVDGAMRPGEYMNSPEVGQLTSGVTFRYWPDHQPQVLVPGVGAAGNWLLALGELYVGNPWADRYAMFQDDLTCPKNLKTYLEASWENVQGASIHPTTKLRSPFYLNLYTFMDNETVGGGQKGWHPTQSTSKKRPETQVGRGAVGLVFDKATVIELLSSRELVSRYSEQNRQTGHGTNRIDGAVVHILNKAGYREMCHIPSLVQHLGIQSTMGPQVYPQAKTYVEGDAAEWIKDLPDVPPPPSTPSDVDQLVVEDKRLQATRQAASKERKAQARDVLYQGTDLTRPVRPGGGRG